MINLSGEGFLESGGGGGTVGSVLAGFLKGYSTTHCSDVAPHNSTLPSYKLIPMSVF